MNAISLPALTPAEVLATVGALGYAGVEWRVAQSPSAPAGEPPSFWGHSRSTLPPVREAMLLARRLSAHHGLAVIGICPYVPVGDLAYLKQVFALARAAGAAQVRLFAPARAPGQRYADLLAAGVAFFREAARLACEHDVRAVVEMHHGTICPSASLTERLVSTLDPRYVGVIYDTGNLVHEGFEDHQIAFDVLGDYLAHVHLKNAAWRRREDGAGWEVRWAPLDEGVIDVERVIQELRRRDYAGWVAMEEFSRARPAIDGLRHNHALVSRWLGLTPGGAQ